MPRVFQNSPDFGYSCYVLDVWTTTKWWWPTYVLDSVVYVLSRVLMQKPKKEDSFAVLL